MTKRKKNFIVVVAGRSAKNNNNNNNNELYLHDDNNTALQKRGKHDKGQISLSLISKHGEMNIIDRRLT